MTVEQYKMLGGGEPFTFQTNTKETLMSYPLISLYVEI